MDSKDLSMKVEIVDRLSPLSHRPGIHLMIPGTFWQVQAFPSALEVTSLETGEKKQIVWDLKGPIFPFTAEQNIDKERVFIYGQSQEGYFRYLLCQEKKELILSVEKTPAQGLCPLKGLSHPLHKGDKVVLFSDLALKKPCLKERLFLGVNKQKNWDRIRERKDLKEIMPLWHALGQLLPQKEWHEGPSFALLRACQKKVQKREKDIEDLFLALYLSSFFDGLVPRGYDDEFHGILPPLMEETKGAIALLPEIFSITRALFFQEEEGVYSILPCLPSGFVSGKMMHIRTAKGCHIHLEWTKGKIRTMIIFAEKEAVFFLDLPKEVQNYRLRESAQERGYVLDRKEEITLRAGSRIYLDRFQR
jgi:hypothetical protein